MAAIKISANRCTGCGFCLKVCPVSCITLKEKLAVIDENACTRCGACRQACFALWEKSADKTIFNAVEIEASAGAKRDLSGYKNVWCFAEVLHGKLSPAAFELLHIGRKLADGLGEKLCAVVMGKDVSGFCPELAQRGADIVYACSAPELENFVDENYAKCLAALVAEKKPNKLIFPATTLGRSLAAKAAILADTGLTADVTDLTLDKETGLMQATRPTFGGNLMATIVCADRRPEMCSLRPLTYPQSPKDESRKGEIIPFAFNPASHGAKAKFISFVPEEAGELDIGAAEIIVSGGRGLGKPEGFELIRKLAHALGGAVGASRAAVDSGWIAYRHQIGLTGKTVKPKLYLAFGISGQVQHTAGMSSSDLIVAVNRDPAAPLMEQAAYTVEADLYEFIPALLEELSKPVQ